MGFQKKYRWVVSEREKVLLSASSLIHTICSWTSWRKHRELKMLILSFFYHKGLSPQQRRNRGKPGFCGGQTLSDDNRPPAPPRVCVLNAAPRDGRVGGLPERLHPRADPLHFPASGRQGLVQPALLSPNRLVGYFPFCVVVPGCIFRPKFNAGRRHCSSEV